MTLTAERLRELLTYDKDTGVFRWLVSRNMAKVGKCQVGAIAGYINDINRGYIEIGIDGGRYLAHRLAVLWITGSWPAEHVDHADGNTGNNAWSNLREATRSQNLANMNGRCQSGLKGAYRARNGRWYSRIMVGRQDMRLGTYDTAEEAHAAYRAAAIEHFGEFARF